MQIGNGGEQVKSQAKAFSAISVSAAQDTKAFECSQDVFNRDAS